PADQQGVLRPGDAREARVVYVDARVIVRPVQVIVERPPELALRPEHDPEVVVIVLELPRSALDVPAANQQVLGRARSDLRRRTADRGDLLPAQERIVAVD